MLLIARTRGHSPSADRAVATFSRLGEHGGGWIALGIAGALLDHDPQRRSAWRHGTAITLAAYGLNQTLKVVIRRPRPELPGLPPLTPTVTNLSFPSAHATTSFAAARSFAGLLAAGPLYAAAVALAASRPYLGVHYPSDVIAGALLGMLVAELGRR